MELSGSEWGLTFYSEAHAAGSAGHHLHGAFHCEAVEVSHLVLGDLFYLLPAYLAHLLAVAFLGALFTLAASISCTAAGGVLMTKSKDLSA